MTLPILAIIIPCFNEEECLPSTLKRLLNILSDLEEINEISKESFIFCVSDGSVDKTWELLEKYNNEYNGKVKGIKLTRNFGNQKAILAGLLEASNYNPDCYISIDADLQQDENKIKDFLQKYKEGAQIVCGIRTDRKDDILFKKVMSLAFYKIMNILGVNIKVNHSDFRLVSNEVIQTLKNFPEKNLFLRGIFNDLGYKTEYILFDVKKRKYGKTKYSSFALFSMAISAITSFSLVPLRFVTFLGFIISFLSFCFGLYILIGKFMHNDYVAGWATIVISIGFISGIQILCLGIIAEYLGQLFQEVKSRPRYIIERHLK
jgi:glycosyltransferase involved in cell wall biosynthesis